MKTQIKITGKKRYPSNYEVRWEELNNSDNMGLLSISTDGLIDGDYYDDEANEEGYVEEGFNTYVLEEAKEQLENEGYEVIEVSNFNY